MQDGMVLQNKKLLFSLIFNKEIASQIAKMFRCLNKNCQQFINNSMKENRRIRESQAWKQNQVSLVEFTSAFK